MFSRKMISLRGASIPCIALLPARKLLKIAMQLIIVFS